MTFNPIQACPAKDKIIARYQVEAILVVALEDVSDQTRFSGARTADQFNLHITGPRKITVAYSIGLYWRLPLSTQLADSLMFGQSL